MIITSNKVMNSGSSPTQWFRDREDELGTLLRYELGADAVAQLEAHGLLNSPGQVPENACLNLIDRALTMIGHRDMPCTLHVNGLGF